MTAFLYYEDRVFYERIRIKKIDMLLYMVERG